MFVGEVKQLYAKTNLDVAKTKSICYKEIFICYRENVIKTNVYDINDPHARGIIRTREHQIEAAEGEHVKQGDFADIQLENANLRRQNFVQHVRGK